MRSPQSCTRGSQCRSVKGRASDDVDYCDGGDTLTPHIEIEGLRGLSHFHKWNSSLISHSSPLALRSMVKLTRVRIANNILYAIARRGL